MRKLLAATALMFAVAAVPALASGIGQSSRVGDRVGGDSGDYVPRPLVIGLAVAALATTVWIWDEDRDNDKPVSA